MDSGETRFSVKLGEEVHAYVIGDFHEGNANVDYTALKKAVRQIAADPGPKVVFLMGDFIEAIMPDDKRWEPAAVYRGYALRDLKNLPYLQADNICDILEPISKDVRAILVGNHEGAYIKRHFGDIYGHMAKRFPNATKLGGCGFFRVYLDPKGENGRAFDFALKHGISGGGKMLGYVINKVRESFEFEMADFCIMGHLHKLVAQKVRYRQLNHTGNNIMEYKMWYGCSGTFKRTYVMGNADWYEPRGREEADIGYLKATMSVTRLHKSDSNRPYICETKLEVVTLD
jgi:hypothetical protein